MNRVVVPVLGEGIETATVACWHVKPGDPVRADDDLVELVIDKAAFNVPAGSDGTLKAILVPEGQEVAVGGDLALIDPSGGQE